MLFNKPMDKTLTLTANAKINLTLDVLAKRTDGYHEVAMIMQSIDLADRLTFREQPSGIAMQTNVAGLPVDRRNLAYQAAELVKSTFQIKTGIHIELNKEIPLSAGLAGGSADAAGVLTGLNSWWKLGLTLDELCDLGAVLGSDVPFCLHGGTMLATGRGELLTPVAAMPPCYIVLAKPAASVSTAWVYRNYRPGAVEVHPDTAAMLAFLRQADLAGVAGKLANVLESVTIARHPEIGQLKAWMVQCGAMASLMSGSGPTVFGLAADREEAESIAAKLRNLSNAQIIVAKTVGGMRGENAAKIITN
ncbi:4-diphosphocytidyl-2-C-methyl-D-erythritol kinase [Dendrosporobacter quercicolus]|uniref:4-diphosphocytidyl-2-C-methyl-D-erythritol kinase n=2 Tax=Dendrosporobacter quercicolus TaxID=146817 RepID=A0A1G9QPT7_9FIRM|nr:4-diphosphocytidyl-2-C-methyl-D-erythritol kinase [Dendrosporobacter quercicolus]